MSVLSLIPSANLYREREGLQPPDDGTKEVNLQYLLKHKGHLKEEMDDVMASSKK